jgi:hypothetical protein
VVIGSWPASSGPRRRDTILDKGGEVQNEKFLLIACIAQQKFVIHPLPARAAPG